MGRGAAADGSARRAALCAAPRQRSRSAAWPRDVPGRPPKKAFNAAGLARDSRWCSFRVPSDAGTGRLGCPGRLGRVAVYSRRVGGVRRSEEVALIPAINGRPVISRADMAARGVPRSTVDGWYRDRARTGYPEKAGRVGRTDYWYEDEWTGWYEGHRRGKIGSLTEVDRGCDPDDLVDAAEAARMLRYDSRYVIHANRRLGYFPEPDAYGKAARGRSAPLWKRSTVWAAADRREGKGGGHKPGTPGAPAKPHPYAGDERLDRVLAELHSGVQPSVAGLAAEWDVSRRTAERIVQAARTLLES